MDESEVQTTVRIPLAKLIASTKERHSIAFALDSAKIEGDYLILSFSNNAPGLIENSALLSDSVREESGAFVHGDSESLPVEPRRGGRRRRMARRNRMKTRGWNIVSKMMNSKGQTVAIYEPFVLALRGKKLRRTEAAKLVSQVLVANGNRPGRVSVDYYLTNTLEYLASEGEK